MKPRHPRPTLVDAYLTELDPDGRAFGTRGHDPCPSSIAWGAAGAAYFLYRLGTIEESHEIMNWSKSWVEQAVQTGIENPDRAFFSIDDTLARERIGESSLFHSMSGVRLIQVLIARAMQDKQSEALATAAFSRLVSRSPTHTDIFLGSAGELLGCAHLAQDGAQTSDDVRVAGDTLLAGTLANLGDWIEDANNQRAGTSVGVAHGGAGLIQACLVWTEAIGGDIPDEVYLGLDALSGLGTRNGRATTWERVLNPSRSGESDTSWCNGSAGIGLVYLTAARMLDDDSYLQMGLRAVFDLVERGTNSVTLCCGAAGHVYSLRSASRLTGDKRWERHGHLLAQEAARWLVENQPHATDSHGLFKSGLGLALTTVDGSDEAGTMPFFEPTHREPG